MAVPKPWEKPLDTSFNGEYPTEFRQSQIEGGGLGWWAKVDIPAGVCMRKLSVAEGTLVRLSSEEELHATGWDIDQCVNYATGHFKDPGAVYWTCPGTKMNHSWQPSIEYRHTEAGKMELWTMRGVSAGEELFNHYGDSFASCDWFEKLQNNRGNICLWQLPAELVRTKEAETFDAHSRLAESYAAMKQVQGSDPGKATEIALHLYDDWALSYDETLTKWGYKVPAILGGLIATHGGDPAAKVMDFACGTGLIGQELAARGYKTIDGCDLSPDSLKYIESKKPAVYQDLKVVDMNKFPYPYADNEYSLYVCGGSLNYADDPYKVLLESIRLVRPGGLFVISWSYNAKEAQDWPEALVAVKKLEDLGKWEKLHDGEPEPYGHEEAEIGNGRVLHPLVFRIK